MNNNIQPPLRSRGNLQYLDFIDRVAWAWAQGHSDIPIVPSSGENLAQYPCITYYQLMRKPFDGEPKPKIRQVANRDTNTSVVISGQRFDTIVAFSAIAESKSGGPRLAEEIVEIFEAFMLEMTPAFKEWGLSEILYSRRISDTEEMRPGEGIVRRTVCYKITTETIVETDYEKLRNIVINARLFFQQENCYFVSDSTGDPADTIRIVGKNGEFSIGDKVMVSRRPGDALPSGLAAGSYVIYSISYSGDSTVKQYLLAKQVGDDLEAQGGFGVGSGYIHRIEDDVTINIEDDYMTGATPNS